MASTLANLKDRSKKGHVIPSRRSLEEIELVDMGLILGPRM